MIITLSPAKKLDFESESHAEGGEQPRLLDQAEDLVKTARSLKADDLKALMGISDALAALNVERFQAFSRPFTAANARPAIDAFKGDVYVGLDAPSLDAADRAFANQHIRILSGLYGVLRPLDLMQAYRLEMGIRLQTARGHTLYEYWGDQITDLLNSDVAATKAPALINLASTEYFKSVRPKGLTVPVITPVFKEVKDGRARTLAFFAKKARGMMARFVVQNRLDDPQSLKGFGDAGYRFDPEASTDVQWVFSRPHPGT